MIMMMMTLVIIMMATMMLMLPRSGLGALVDVDKLGQTRRSVSLPSLDDVRVGVEGSSCPHKAATLRGKNIVFAAKCPSSDSQTSLA